MPPISALLHTTNDALRLGRTLETLLPCAEILILDHHSTDTTRRIARQYGARVLAPDSYAGAKHYLDLARHEWIFCMKPGESITEALQASLFEWSTLPRHAVSHDAAFSVFVRQQTGKAWRELPEPETRLVPRSWNLWHERLPASDESDVALEGELLRFDLP
jgi:hypothetical protein